MNTPSFKPELSTWGANCCSSLHCKTHREYTAHTLGNVFVLVVFMEILLETTTIVISLVWFVHGAAVLACRSQTSMPIRLKLVKPHYSPLKDIAVFMDTGVYKGV